METWGRALIAVALAMAIAACGPSPSPSASSPLDGPARETFPLDGPARETFPLPGTPPPSGTFPSGSPIADGSPAASGSSPPAGTPAPTSQPPVTFDPSSVSIEFRAVATAPGRPLAIASAGDGSGRLFVAEQGGAVYILEGGAVAPTPFLDISAQVSGGGEQGLLGLAFHPDYPADNRVFVDYTNAAGDTVVSSFEVDPASPDVVVRGSEAVILTVDQPYPNHNGGTIAFGPDGYLYIALGDGGSGGDPHNYGQRLDTLLGKILRIDVDNPAGGQNYGIPPPTRSPARQGRAARSGSWASATRSASRSTATPATSGSATWARTPGRRSTSRGPVSAA